MRVDILSHLYIASGMYIKAISWSCEGKLHTWEQKLQRIAPTKEAGYCQQVLVRTNSVFSSSAQMRPGNNIRSAGSDPHFWNLSGANKCAS